MKTTTRLAFALLAAAGAAYSEKLHITTPSELIKLANEVNSGTQYVGTTVYLDNDLDFRGLSDQFTAIGRF